MDKTLQNHYKTIIIYNLLTKVHYKNRFEIPQLTKICLNIGCQDSNLNKKNVIKLILLLKLITNQKPFLTKSKKNNIFFKIKKNAIIGCKITLKQNNIFLFLEKLLLFIVPTLPNIKITQQNILNFKIHNILDFFELKTEFIKFTTIPPIDVSIHSNVTNRTEFFLLLNSLFFVKIK